MENHLTGQRFGRLVVAERSNLRGKHPSSWWCICDCGTTKAIRSDVLKRGGAKSCGCLRAELTSRRMRIHGLVGAPLYKVWFSMLERCHNPKSPAFYRYGGRGIKVHPAWWDYERFYSDFGCTKPLNPPERLTIDRLDNDDDYWLGNVRWATNIEQARNMRSNRILEHAGEALCIAEWAERVGIGAATIQWRVQRGWDAARALTQPICQT